MTANYMTEIRRAISQNPLLRWPWLSNQIQG